jgi:hypothetical protein
MDVITRYSSAYARLKLHLLVVAIVKKFAGDGKEKEVDGYDRMIKWKWS